MRKAIISVTFMEESVFCETLREIANLCEELPIGSGTLKLAHRNENTNPTIEYHVVISSESEIKEAIIEVEKDV